MKTPALYPLAERVAAAALGPKAGDLNGATRRKLAHTILPVLQKGFAEVGYDQAIIALDDAKRALRAEVKP